jgi:hypothetical protein
VGVSALTESDQRGERFAVRVHARWRGSFASIFWWRPDKVTTFVNSIEMDLILRRVDYLCIASFPGRVSHPAFLARVGGDAASVTFVGSTLPVVYAVVVCALRKVREGLIG